MSHPLPDRSLVTSAAIPASAEDLQAQPWLVPGAEVTVFWVLPEGATWQVRRDGDRQPLGTFALRDDAADRARALALGLVPSLVKVVDASGRLVGEYNYGATFLADIA